MAPRVERTPPYMQVVEHFRQKIRDGELKDGNRLPTTRQLCDEWGVAIATVIKALNRLQAEGLVRTSQAGTFVSAYEAGTFTPRDRLVALSRVGRVYPPGDRSQVVDAGVVAAPEHVAAALGVEPGAPVISRRRITYHEGDHPVTISTSWLDGELAKRIPDLLTKTPIPGGTVGLIREVTGRTPSTGRDQMAGRGATQEEAEGLGVAEGTPVLVGRNWWYDDENNVIEYGEFVIPQNTWVSYDYTV